MKLYYTPGACSLSPHIVLCEAGLRFELVKVDLANKKTESGEDFRAINPKGYVPLLRLDDGSLLTEGPAIVQYLADQRPQSGLAPAPASRERYDLQSWLNFISTELHKQYSPLFRPTSSKEQREAAIAAIENRYAWLDKELVARDYVYGKRFSVADAYLFTVTNWAGFIKFDLGRWKSVVEYQKRIAARPAVQQALKAEGLLG